MSDKNDGRASWDANSMIENAKSLQRVAPLQEGPQPRYGSPDRRRPWPGMVGGEYPDEDTGAHESWFTILPPFSSPVETLYSNLSTGPS